MKNRSSAFRLCRSAMVTLALSLLLAACGNVLGSSEALQLYVLSPPPAAATGAAVNWRLVIDRPFAPDSLDTQRIALKPTAVTMDYYADASWQDSLPTLLQSLLVEHFERDGRVAAVGRDTSSINGDYTLRSDIRSFQAVYPAPDAPPRIELRVGVTLVSQSTGNVVGTREFMATAQASANAMPAIVEAFDQATGMLLADMANWAIQTAPPVARKPAAPGQR
jgi:cholesterol transport system auxiliary component